MTNKELMSTLKNIKADRIQRHAIIATGIFAAGLVVVAVIVKRNNYRLKTNNQQLMAKILSINITMEEQCRQIESLKKSIKEKNLAIVDLNKRFSNNSDLTVK